MRGDGYDPASAPGYPERDYGYGLLLATTGLRREECAFLLEAEVPAPETMGSESIHVFDRLGKKQVVRSIYITAQVARATDLYRRTERHRVVQAAQRGLRAKIRDGSLLVVDDLIEPRGNWYVATGSQRIPMVRFTNKDRAKAVRVRDDGTIDPLAMFVSRSGLPPGLERWNQLFADARDRVCQSGHPEQPPRHVHVTPHTMRHSGRTSGLSRYCWKGFTRCRRQAPTGRHANPTLVGGSDDEAARTNRCRQERLPSGGPKFGVSMSGYVWDLSGTGRQCDSYRAGHQIHLIHFNHSMREPSKVIPVTASVDDDGLVHIEGEDLSLVRWNHQPALVRAALQSFGGRAEWKPRWYLLVVPAESFVGSARSVFSLVAPDERRDCHVTRTTNPDHVVASVPSSTSVPPLRIAAQYAAGRKRGRH